MTRALLRFLLTRAIGIAGVILVVLIVMNFVTNQRLEEQKQDSLRSTLGIVMSADRYGKIGLSSFRESYPDMQDAYAAYDKHNVLIGYVIDVKQTSAQGEWITRMSFSQDGKTLNALKIIGSGGTDLQSIDFSGQFSGIAVPAALLSDLPDETAVNDIYPPIAGLQDGTYMEKLSNADSSGYKDFVQMVISGGRIVRVTWDAIQNDGGSNRAKASVNGEYVLPDNTVIWAAQAYAMQNKLIEVQDPKQIAIKADGTTVLIPDVTMNVNAFLRLSNKCIEDSKNGRTASIESPTLTPTPNANKHATPTAIPSDMASISQPSPTASPVTSGVRPDDSITPVPTLPTETNGDSHGSEDGIVLDDKSNTPADSIDGLPFSEIKTKIIGLPDNQPSSRLVVSAVNQAYQFLKNYLEGRAE